MVKKILCCLMISSSAIFSVHLYNPQLENNSIIAAVVNTSLGGGITGVTGATGPTGAAGATGTCDCSGSSPIDAYGYFYLDNLGDVVVNGGSIIPFNFASTQTSPYNMSLDTDTGQVTILTPGVYAVDYAVQQRDGLEIALGLLLNGSDLNETKIGFFSDNSSSFTAGTIFGHYLVTMYAGDVISVKNRSGVPLTIIPQGGSLTSLRIFKIAEAQLPPMLSMMTGV